MAFARRSDQARYARKHYELNTAAYKAKARILNAKNRLRNRRFVDDYLRSHPCVDCGEADIDVLEFAHVRGVKVDTISSMLRGTPSIKRIAEEIAKCEVRCANCHRRRTLKEMRLKAALARAA